MDHDGIMRVQTWCDDGNILWDHDGILSVLHGVMMVIYCGIMTVS